MNNMTQPVIVLSEGTQRTRGRSAQMINIQVAKMVAEIVRTTLGPKGMDKMIVDELGDITITNDGATILDNMSIDHPAGKMLVEVAKTQDNECGDGTTSAVAVAGELLNEASRLIEQDVHPSIIIKGYRMASERALETLDKLAEPLTINDKKDLIDVAKTSMTGKAAEGKDVLSEMTVEAIIAVTERNGDKLTINKDNIKVEKKAGDNFHNSKLIKGIVLDKEVVHAGMPKHLEKVKIALIDGALEIKETETDAKIQVADPTQLQAFLDQEEKMLKGMVESIKKSNANVVLCQKGIDDLAQHFLAKEGIMAIRRVKKSDMEKVAKATGASIVNRVQDLTKEDLGYAGSVYEKKIAGDDMVFIENCKDPKAVTLLIRGGTSHVIDEAERAVQDALGAVTSAIEDGKIVTGAGAIQIDLSLDLKKFAKGVGGREQLAIESFANALEIIPRTLAETAGMDAIDTLVDLRAKHEKGSRTAGVNVFTRKTADMRKEKVIEPARITKQVITGASDAAELILRIDDIIAGGSSKGHPPDMGGGMPPGMGGMGMPGMGM
ncbi:MAG: TCP-1/cpn60 chaperonin family protein [Candidatus Diapherotrites archaeon]|nr:TCP-1/cpn60 chaperonin family protein [Candidatus Diapherotrites archaeon]